ncbi:MAG: AI-2E family transporter [Candidatus Pacebacteria bacterium]|nr:AI-2E family transporter [Candidatus Paceibacterota bacterium]
MEENKFSINISVGTVIKILTILVIAVFLYMIRGILMSVILSLVIASGIEPAAAWLQKRKIPRALAVVFIYMAAFLFLGAMFYIIIPTTFSELTNFSDNIPLYLEKPFEAGTVDKIFGNLPMFVRDGLGNSITMLGEYIDTFTASFFDFASMAVGGVVSFILVIVLSFYLSVQENGVENFLRIIIPTRHEDYAISLWMRWRKKIGYWLQGQILLGFIVGVLVYIGLTLLQVKYALTFAILAAIFELIPIFGPILSAIPPIIVALLENPWLALEVLILYVIIQQFENHLIYPLVVRKIVGVPAVVVILALVIGANVGGFVGMLLAVPLATIAMEVLDDINYRKKRIAKPTA